MIVRYFPVVRSTVRTEEADSKPSSTVVEEHRTRQSHCANAAVTSSPSGSVPSAGHFCRSASRWILSISCTNAVENSDGKNLYSLASLAGELGVAIVGVP
jgi:hypothetical protein